MPFFISLPLPPWPPVSVLVAWIVTLFCCVGSVHAARQENAFLFQPEQLGNVIVASLLVLSPELFGYNPRPLKKQRRDAPSLTVPWVRRQVSSIMLELGKLYTHRAYRMRRKSFWRLHDLLLPSLISNCAIPSPTSKKNWRNGARNGLIGSDVRLSIALRYFAGGCPYDISIAHGVSHTEVFESVWRVVDAVNSCDALSFQFPDSHEKQQQLAREFATKSKAEFSSCAAAIDGILIWIHKPTEEDCAGAKCGAKKFLCGRKKKFGLNMQGTCDARGRFLDISIGHPGATSDFLAFMTSPLKLKLEEPGFLAPGLVLFGDNAYVSTFYMATPFKGVSKGPKDAYNFYHSQLRISIECAFGMLVHRWGILRKAIPRNILVTKTCALVLCLCRLHNFCIDRKDSKAKAHTAVDAAVIASEGGVDLDRRGIPRDLLGGGDHFQDDPTRTFRRSAEQQPDNDPRGLLLEIVINKDIRRPTPNDNR